MESMKSLISILTVAALYPILAAQAQLPPPNEAGVSIGHIHLVVRDIEANKKVFVAMGGKLTKFGDNEIVKFPGILIFFRQGDPTGPSVGSVVNHFGFHVPNVQESVKKWNAAGVKTEPGARPTQAYVVTPDGVRIEILEDADLKVPIVSDHIHFYVAESAIPEIQSWYAKTFGARPGKRGNFQSADVPGMTLLFAKSDTAAVPTKGRALDHIGFEIQNLEAFCKKLEASGVKFDRPYGHTPTGLGIAFITDPWGTYIELNEGLNKL